MGLREKVTIALVIISLIQIACRHCMPRTPRKASLKRYLNDLKPGKNNPVPTPYSPSRLNKTPKQTLGKTAQNGRINQNSPPNQSLYKTYNFPENEYPLDNSPRDPFHIGMNFNDNCHVNTLQKAQNLQSSAINDLKKDIKMKRKLLNNRQVNNPKSQLKTDTSSIKIASNTDSIRLLDSETFPEVQYPLSTMETWGPNYWNYLPFTQEKPLNELRRRTLSSNSVKPDMKEPFTRLTKAKASKYLQSYEKLKEEQRRTSTENSKRSNVGQKGLNFTKTETCEKVSDDFITAGLVSNIHKKTSNTKTQESTSGITARSENTCPVTEYPYHPKPIPYKVIEENTKNTCPAFDATNNTKQLEDEDNNFIAQTLQLIQEILRDEDDDTSSAVPPDNYTKDVETPINSSDYTNDSAKKDILLTTLMDSVRNCTDTPIEALSLQVFNDFPSDILSNKVSLLPEEILPDNSTTHVGPLNVRMPLSFTEPDMLTNVPTDTALLSNSIAVPGFTSIIIIPINNNSVSKLQSNMFETSDRPIYVYLPSVQSKDIPTQTLPYNHILPSPFNKPVSNNQLNNDLSNMAPLQNDNPSSTALVSELLNGISDSGSSLPIYESLPTNSMCYNNENSPSSTREEPISDILIHKSLTDDATFVTSSCGEKLPRHPVETGNFDVNTDILPQTTEFEHPLFDFPGSDITSLSHGPYNNVLNNELPIIAREINLDEQVTNTSSIKLIIPSQNITSDHLHKNISIDSVLKDSLSVIPNNLPTVAIEKNISSEAPTENLDILKNTPFPHSHQNLFVNSPNPSSQIAKQLSESPPQPVHQITHSTPLIETFTAELTLPEKSSYSPVSLFENFSDKTLEIMKTKLPVTSVPNTAKDSAPQLTKTTPVPLPVLNSSPKITDMSLKTELYKIRQILDKVLSEEAAADSQQALIDRTLSPISDTDSLPSPIDKTLSPISDLDNLPPPMDKTMSPISATGRLPLPVDKTLSPILDTDNLPPPLDKTFSPISNTNNLLPPMDNTLSPISDLDNLPPPMDKTLSPISATGRLPLPVDKTLSPILDTDNLPPPMDKTLSPISDTDNLPPPMDKTLSPISDLDNLPPPMDKTMSPISATGRLPLPVDKTLSPILDTDNLPPPLDKTFSPISNTNNLLPPMDNTLSPISDLDNLPPPMDKTLSPISTTGRLPLSVDITLSPISNTDNLPPPMDKTLLPISDTDNLPPPMYKTLSPISDTDNLPLPMDKTLSPISDTDNLPPPMDKTLSPISNLDNLPPPMDKTLSPISATGRLPLPVDKTLSPILDTDNLPPPMDKTLSPISNTNNLLPPMDKTLSPISDLDNLPPPMDKTLSPISATGRLPLSEDLTLPPISNTDNLPPPMDKTLLPISDTDNLPPPMYKTLSPISDTDNLPLPMDKTLSPISGTGLLPVPVDKTLTPISDTENPPLLLDKTLSPISVTGRLPLPVDKILSPISDTDSLELPMDKTVSSNSDIDSPSSPISKTLSPISDTDSPASPIYKKILPISDQNNVPSPIDDTLLPITDTASLPSPIDKTLSFLLDTDSLESPIDKTRSLFSTHDNLQSSVDKTLPPVSNDDLPSPMDKPLSPISNHESLPSLTDKTLSPIQESNSLPPPGDKTLLPIPDSNRLPSLGDKTLLSISDSVSLPSPFDKTLTPILDCDNLPSPIDTTLSPISNTDSRLSSPIDIKLAPISNTDSPPSPIDKKFSPVSDHDNLPSPMDKTLSPISDTGSLPPPINKTLLPISDSDSLELPMDNTLSTILDCDSFPSPKDNTLLPTSDTDNLRPLMNESLLPTHSSTDTVVLPAVDETLLPPTEGNIDSFRLQVNEPLLPTPDNETCIVTLPFPEDNLLITKVLESDIPSLQTDDIVPACLPVFALISETSADNKPYLIDNLVTPLSESVTFRSKDAPNNGLPHTIHNLPSKMDLVIPDIYEVSPVTVNNSPLTVHHTTNPLHGYESLNNFYEDPVTDLQNPTDVMSLPVKEVFETISTGDSTVSVESSLSDIPCNNSAFLVDESLSLTEDNPADILSPMNLTTPSTSKLQITKALLENVLADITKGNKDKDKIETQCSENTVDNFTLPTDIIAPPGGTLSDISKNEMPPYLKLLITKALLENVLSDINTSSFSLPVYKAIPIKSSSVSNKTLYYIETPQSNITQVETPLPTVETSSNTVLSDYLTSDKITLTIEDALPFVIDKTFSEASSLDISSELLSPKDQIELNTLSNIMYDENRNENHISYSENLNDDLTLLMADIFPLSKSTPSDLPITNSKTPPSSKLLITKALLENVLTDINTRGFSLPVAKAPPAVSRSQLDKTLYFLVPPLLGTTVVSSHSNIPKDNFPPSKVNEEGFTIGTDKNNRILGTPTDKLPTEKMYNDKSDMLAEDIDSSETSSDDSSSDHLPKQVDDQLLLTDGMPSDLPKLLSKPYLASRLPIAKVLLEKVLSDITDTRSPFLNNQQNT